MRAIADVEGSTWLWETQPQEIRAAVARLDRVLAEVVSAHAGVRPVEQGEGDSFVIAFTRVSDAVACALALQAAPLAPIRLRTGYTSASSPCATSATTSAQRSTARPGCPTSPTAGRR
jgi:class 3 adenylate cyclase